MYLFRWCSHCAAKADGREKQEDYQLGDGRGGDGGDGGDGGRGGGVGGHRHGRACGRAGAEAWLVSTAWAKVLFHCGRSRWSL